MNSEFSKSDINRFLTDLCNGNSVTQKQKKFLRKALDINLNQKCSFCYDHFPELTPVNFRQYVSKLRKFITVACKSKPCFYRIKGTPERMAVPSITDKPTGESMLLMLRNARAQPSSIHNIRVQAFSENFHEILRNQGFSSHSKNSGILLPTFHYKINTLAKVHVYPRTVSIDIACTNRPLVYDVTGVVNLLLILGMLYRDLMAYSKFEAVFSPVTEWIVKSYHLGKDATQSFCAQSFEMRFDELITGTFRYYNKLGEDGKRKLHVEHLAHPDLPLMEEIDRMIANEEKFHESNFDKMFVDGN